MKQRDEIKNDVNAVRLSLEDMEKISGGAYGKTAHTILLTSKTYNNWIGTSPDQVVLFGTYWASPCVTANEWMETLASENGNYEVGIVDMEENMEWWSVGNYITHVPTIIKFKNGIEVTRIVGCQSIDTLRPLFG